MFEENLHPKLNLYLSSLYKPLNKPKKLTKVKKNFTVYGYKSTRNFLYDSCTFIGPPFVRLFLEKKNYELYFYLESYFVRSKCKMTLVN